MKTHYFNGEYFVAREILDTIQNNQEFSQKADFRLIYHYAGLISRRLGDPNEALMYYNWSEKYCLPPEKNPFHLFHNYNSKGNLYGDQGDLIRAKSFLEQAVNYLSYVKNRNKYYYQRLNAGLQNLGIVLYDSRDYLNARKQFLESLEISIDQNFSDLPFIYTNLGKIADRLNEYSLAEEYYILAIRTNTRENQDTHPYVANTYTEYGEMLILTERYQESLVYLKKALNTFINISGKYSVYTAACYQIIGDLYLAKDSYHQALEYYQLALQSIHPGFIPNDLNDNPPVEGSILDIRYLEIINKKAFALSQAAMESSLLTNKKNLLESSLKATDLAINLKEKIRNSYPSTESILFLAEHEKSIYLNGVNSAYELFILSEDINFGKKAYQLASEWKASELLRKINSRQALNQINISDSLNSMLKECEYKISTYNGFLMQEDKKENPDSSRLLKLKNDLFEINRKYENTLEIAKTRAWYKRLHRKPETTDIKKLQKQLSGKQSILEYVISKGQENSLNQLYIFIITKKDFKIFRQNPDAVFYSSLDYYLKELETFPDKEANINSFDSLRNSLFHLYGRLIEPVKHHFSGKELFIIPDERLNILPFESLIDRKTKEDIVNYSGLSYLINQYTISYAYSADLLFAKKNYFIKRTPIIGFAPAVVDFDTPESEWLKGTQKELKSISRLFHGNYYYGKDASLTNLYASVKNRGVFHFAMHSNRERDFESGGYLEFYDNIIDSTDGKLWGHEISFMEINSPMVCLSGCNSGLGIINKSEGVLSLTRNFMEAGAASVIHSLWEINDYAGSDLMIDFYTELARGQKKNKALQKAKLKFLSETSPNLHHPFYWSGYQIVGSINPIRLNPLIIPGAVLLIIISGLLYFFRRRIFRRRFSEGT